MSSTRRQSRPDLKGFVTGAAAALALLGCATALLQPVLLWAVLAFLGLLGGVWLAYRYPSAATIGWLALVATTPEMWLGDLTGEGPLIIACVKLAGIGLAAICIARYGPVGDVFNPMLAFLVMFAIGLTHRRPAELDFAEGLRSLIGSIAPFAFSYARLAPGWARAVIRAIRWLPLLVVGFGLVLAIAGVRPLFVIDNGWRLQASGHPAFLAGFALAALDACLLELLRGGRSSNIGLLGLNMLILVLTGARAPLAIAAAVCAITLLFIPSAGFPPARRVTLVLIGAALLPLLVALAGALDRVRLFQMLSGDAGSLSGRDLLWPWFADAWNSAPWLGWGVGAAKTVLSEGSPLVRLVGTRAPHNEYLRIGVEGGWLGLLLLIGLLAAWTVWHTRRMPRADRWFIRVVLLAFAVHAYTDNTLIATTSSVFFAFVSAAFALGAAEGAPIGRGIDAAGIAPRPLPGRPSPV